MAVSLVKTYVTEWPQAAAEVPADGLRNVTRTEQPASPEVSITDPTSNR